MIDTKKFTALKQKVDEIQQAKSKAEGAYDQLIAQLKEEHGCDSLKEGKKLLAQLEEECAKDTEAFNKALAAFEEEHKDVLDA